MDDVGTGFVSGVVIMAIAGTLLFIGKMPSKVGENWGHLKFGTNYYQKITPDSQVILDAKGKFVRIEVK